MVGVRGFEPPASTSRTLSPCAVFTGGLRCFLIIWAILGPLGHQGDVWGRSQSVGSTSGGPRSGARASRSSRAPSPTGRTRRSGFAWSRANRRPQASSTGGKQTKPRLPQSFSAINARSCQLNLPPWRASCSVHDSRPFGVAHSRAWRHTGPWPQQGFNLIPDLDASLSCTVPSCRCPPNLSAWRPAATFFELEEANSKNVSNAVGTAALRPCVQHECATDGANPCAKTGACFVRSRWVPCVNSVRRGLRPMCQQRADTPPRSVASCRPAVWRLWEGSAQERISAAPRSVSRSEHEPGC